MHSGIFSNHVSAILLSIFSQILCPFHRSCSKFCIHHTRLVQCHSGVHSLRDTEDLKVTWRERACSGSWAESNMGTTLQLLDSVCEPAPKPAQCQLDLCGQQPGGQKTATLDLGEVRARGECTFQRAGTLSSGNTESLMFRSFSPHCF